MRAIRYAADNGARVINWSQLIYETRPEKLAALKEALEYAGKKNVLLIAGAGNDARDMDVDSNCGYPQCLDTENMIGVADVHFTGALFRYNVGNQTRGGNWGVKRVDIGAMGTNFTTLLRNNVSVYETVGGASNAGPAVAGVAALILSVRPSLTATQIKKNHFGQWDAGRGAQRKSALRLRRQRLPRFEIGAGFLMLRANGSQLRIQTS